MGFGSFPGKRRSQDTFFTPGVFNLIRRVGAWGGVCGGMTDYVNTYYQIASVSDSRLSIFHNVAHLDFWDVPLF